MNVYLKAALEQQNAFHLKKYFRREMGIIYIGVMGGETLIKKGNSVAYSPFVSPQL